MNEFREDMIPIAFIVMLIDGTSNTMAKVALLSLLDTWRHDGKEWTERVNAYDA